MRWPFGPPHLTLKPSKKNKTKKTKKKKQNKKQHKKTKKKKNQERKRKKTQKYQKKSFSVISQNFLFFWQGIQKLPFFDTLAQKTRTQNTIKIGVSACFFLERSYASRNGHFWTKKPKFRNSSYHFFSCLFFSFKNKKHKNLLKPLFLKCFRQT